MKEYTYYVKGMHCASCEVLIEKQFLTLPGIKAVEASLHKGEVLIEYEGEAPAIGRLNKIFQKENYIFSYRPISGVGEENIDIWEVIVIALVFIAGFAALNKLGIVSLININANSSLWMILGFGLMAGFSSCAALVGGLVLSMSKQWSELYIGENTSFLTKFQPHLLFNIGRIASYALFGGLLGAIGDKIKFSPQAGPYLILIVSAIMIFLGLQMLGLQALRRFQFGMPKSITRYVADESNFKGRYMPVLLGAATFLLPCGFTITAQSLALISGSVLKGSLIMLFFALGTAPTLLAIGASGAKITSQKHLSAKFLKVAGILVLFFALYNINFQLNVLGISSLSDLGINSSRSSSAAKNNSLQNEAGLPPIINGKQILKMDASSRGYSPNYFKIKVGIPVRWEITDKGTSGCTNAIISKSLFEGEIPLTPGQTSVKEFTPTKTGKYKFSCWMGMVSGIIEVVDETGAAAQSNISNDNGNLFAPSGAESSGGSCSINGKCGCGGR